MNIVEQYKKITARLCLEGADLNTLPEAVQDEIYGFVSDVCFFLFGLNEDDSLGVTYFGYRIPGLEVIDQMPQVHRTLLMVEIFRDSVEYGGFPVLFHNWPGLVGRFAESLRDAGCVRARDLLQDALGVLPSSKMPEDIQNLDLDRICTPRSMNDLTDLADSFAEYEISNSMFSYIRSLCMTNGI